jgi:hypothetical protein
MSERRQNRVVARILPAVVVCFLTLACGCGKKDLGQPHQKATSGVTIQNGKIVITMDKTAQNRAGIIVVPLKAVSQQEELRAYGTVRQPETLIGFRNSYIAAETSADKASAAFDASLKEYERLKRLNEDDRNISDKALQTAGTALASDQADVKASRERVRAVKQEAALRWGKVISEWIFSLSPQLARVLETKEVLILVTLPFDRGIETPPISVGIQAPGSKRVQARFVDRAPNTDPRTQGMGLFYMAARGNMGLVPGMNVDAFLATGRRARGVVIPFSAVVWFQGKAWAYTQTDPTHFVRREVPVRNPLREGYFVQAPFIPEERVVSTGSQVLLSQESLLLMPAGGTGEDED